MMRLIGWVVVLGGLGIGGVWCYNNVADFRDFIDMNVTFFRELKRRA